MKRGHVVSASEDEAARKLAEQIKIPNQAALLFFCTSDYDPKEISLALNREFECPIMGCSSAGEIGESYQTGGIVGVALSKNNFTFSASFIPNLDEYTESRAQELTDRLRAEISSQRTNDNSFALCLIDGLSILEEQFVAFTHIALQGVPLIGGSAGDSLKFKKTTIFCNKDYGSNSAALAYASSEIPFQIFQLNHFSPSEKEMVITSADPQSRTVFEIDGGPAAEEYASILGLTVAELSPQVFSENPLMLQIGNDWYVRAIQKVNPDNSLTFYCAIEEGIPLTIGCGENFVENLRAKAKELQATYQEVCLTIGCDCILRRLEMEQKGIQHDIEAILKELCFIGFSTFGEQINAIHVNQTLTGVVFGKQ